MVDRHHLRRHSIRQKYKLKTRKKNTVGKTYQAQRALTVALDQYGKWNVYAKFHFVALLKCVLRKPWGFLEN